MQVQISLKSGIARSDSTLLPQQLCGVNEKTTKELG